MAQKTFNAVLTDLCFGHTLEELTEKFNDLVIQVESSGKQHKRRRLNPVSFFSQNIQIEY